MQGRDEADQSFPHWHALQQCPGCRPSLEKQDYVCEVTCVHFHPADAHGPCQKKLYKLQDSAQILLLFSSFFLSSLCLLA